MSIIKNIEKDINNLIKEVGYEVDNFILQPTSRPDLGDYQINDCMNLAKKYHKNPREILGLGDFATIKVGNLANVTIIDEKLEWVVKASKFYSRCKISPFDKMVLKGKPVASVVNGKFYDLT